jgi:hypothetical protein
MRNVSQILAAVALIGGLATPAWASTITFVTPTGSTTSGGPVNASAVFTTNNGTLSITLTNLLANPTDVAQLLSDLSFTVSDSTLGAGTTMTSSAPLGTVSVAGNGTYTKGTVPSTGWQLTSASSGQFNLDDLCGSTCAGPAHLVIGGMDTAGLYTAANGSIAGNKPHNPFLLEDATFTLNIPGLTADDTITAATFQFGTTSGANLVRGVDPPAVPEPASLLLLGSGLVAGGVRRLRSRRTPA